MLSSTSDALLICVLQGHGAKEAFQKGFRDKLKKKNRYARSEFRTVADRLLTQICHTFGTLRVRPVCAGCDRFHSDVCVLMKNASSSQHESWSRGCVVPLQPVCLCGLLTNKR